MINMSLSIQGSVFIIWGVPVTTFSQEHKNIALFIYFFQDDVMELDLEAELLASTFDKRRDFSSQSSACGSDLDSSFYR